MTHLGPYRFDTGEKLAPYRCCDVTVNVERDDEKNKEQDAAIKDIVKTLGDIRSTLDKNTEELLGLSGQVAYNKESIAACVEKDNEQDGKIDNVFSPYDDLASFSGGLKSDFAEDFYTKEDADGKFATITSLSEFSSSTETSLRALSAVSNTHEESIGNLDNGKADKDDLSELSGKVLSDENILSGKVDSTAFEDFKSEYSATTSAINDKLTHTIESVEKLNANSVTKADFNSFSSSSTNDLSELYDSTKNNADKISTLKDVYESHGTRITSLETEVAKKADKTYAESLSATTSELVKELSGKAANKEDLNTLSGEVKSYRIFVEEIVNEKAQKSDLNALSGTVNAFVGELPKKASQSDLEVLNGSVNDVKSEVTELSEGKQNKGNYVSATTLNDYYTKKETSGATEISEALALKQPKGEYAIASDVEKNYALKTQLIDTDEYKSFSADVISRIDKKADGGSVGQLDAKVSNLNESVASFTSALKTANNDIAALEEKVKILESGLNDTNSSIAKNKSNVSKISELGNLEKYDPSTGEFNDSGNGVLDVLHKEFHKLVDGIESKDTPNGDLTGLLKSLINRITELEKKVK